MANHRVMKYQDEDNEEQLRLNLNLIDAIRTDAEQRTTRYKSLMAKQYDAMVEVICCFPRIYLCLLLLLHVFKYFDSLKVH